jgi:hypothetical protein
LSVYSTSLFTGYLPQGTATIYTVPTTNTVVIRDIEVWNGSSASAGINFGVLVSGFYGIIWLLNLNEDVWAQWQGRAVCPPGSQIQAYGGGQTTIRACVSGYLLS